MAGLSSEQTFGDGANKGHKTYMIGAFHMSLVIVIAKHDFAIAAVGYLAGP